MDKRPSDRSATSAPAFVIDPDAKLYDRNFLVAFVSQICFVCANTLMAHYARWIEFLGGNLAGVGWIMGLAALAGLLLRPTMAQWINRLGARTMWQIGLGVFAVSSLANLLLSDLSVAIYFMRSGIVLGAAIVFASGLTYISQSTPELRRTEAIGIFGIGGFFGMMIGPLLGDWFLAERTRENFATLFIAASLACLIPMIGLMFLRPIRGGGRTTSVSIGEFFHNARRHWPGMILLVDLAFGVCMASPFVFIASFVDEANLSIQGFSVIGVFFFFYAGIAIIVRLASRRLPDRIGVPKVLIAGILFMSAGMFCFWLVDAAHPWVIVLPALATGVGHSLMFHTMTSLTLQTFPSEVRGTGSALALMMLDLGTLAGAPALGMIGEAFGFGALFATIGAVCLLSGIAYLQSGRGAIT